MSDNVAITAGSGTTIATDDIAGVHYQRVKLVDGTLDGTGAIGGDATNGLDVDVTRLPSLVLSASTGTQEVVGDVAHDAPAAGNPVLVGGYAKAAAPTDVSADADLVQAWYLRNGAAATVLTAAGALVGGDAANGLDVDVTRVPTDPFGANADAASATGSISAKLRFIAATGIPVTGTVTVGSHAVTNAGTFAAQAACAGDIAHDGVDSGNPIKLGMRAIAHGTNPTGVAAADRTDWLASRAGVPFVMGGHPNILTSMQVITTAVTDDSTISGTIAAGAKVVVTQIQFTVDNASTVFPKIIIGFGTANTPASGAGVLAAHPGVPAGGGFSRGDGSGILGVGADGAELRVTTVGTIGGNGGYLTVSYYTIES